MKKETIKKAVIIATGRQIDVYRLKTGGWCDHADCKTMYKDTELRIQ